MCSVRSNRSFVGSPSGAKDSASCRMTGIFFHNDMAVIGLQNITWTIPKSILLL
jgi:hypothetical protein